MFSIGRPFFRSLVKHAGRAAAALVTQVDCHVRSKVDPKVDEIIGNILYVNKKDTDTGAT